jgi:hypothetical protein
VELTAGPALTVNTLVPAPTPPSGLVTLTFPAPVAALPLIEMLAVSELALTKVVELTVIPVAENDTLAPFTNPVPVIVMFWLLAPCPRELGLVDVTVGAALTVNAPVPVALLLSGLLIVTFRTPVAALPLIEMLAVSELALLKVVELTVIPAPENDAAAPFSKLVPLIVMFWLVEPCPRELGLVDVTVGAAFTLNTFDPVALVWSGFVTVTLPAPRVAPALIEMVTVSEVVLLKVVEFMVIPDPENAGVAPLTKLVPLIVTTKLLAPRSPEFGVVEVTVGPALTVNTPVPVALLLSGLVTVTLRAPVAAPPLIETLAVSDVALTKVVELTVIPVPENEAVAPLSKPEPVTVTLKLVAPWSPELGLAEVTVLADPTIKTAPEPTSPSGFVTVIVRDPVEALPPIEMLAVRDELLLNDAELTVIPVPENEIVAPLTKFVPLIVTLKLLAPWLPELGTAPVTVGPATVTDPLAVLVADHDLQTAMTL